MGLIKRMTVWLALTAAAAISAGAAAACDLVTAYQMNLDDAVYEMSLNGVYLDHSDAPSDASGGGPFRQWVLPGENTLTFDLKSGAAEIRVIEACASAFDGETLVQAEMSGREKRDLTFFVETPPRAIYFELDPLPEKGLPGAVKRLQEASTARDFELVWRLHRGLRKTSRLNGFPMKEVKPQFRQMVEEGDVAIETDLIFTPVLGGRVWQVMTRDRKPPVTITMRGPDWSNIFATGVFWTKVDGKWRVVGT